MNVSSSLMVQFPVQASLIDSKKGSIGNRAECAASQAFNRVKENVATGTVLGTSAAGFYAINKYTKGKAFKWNTTINNYLKNTLGKLSDITKDGLKYASEAISSKGAKIVIDKKHADFKNLSKSKQFIARVLEKVQNGLVSGMEKLSKSSGRQKLLIGFGVLAGGVLVHTIRKYAFQSGQIDQKYNDRAKAQKLSV